jgi:hypothetical protein
MVNQWLSHRTIPSTAPRATAPFIATPIFHVRDLFFITYEIYFTHLFRSMIKYYLMGNLRLIILDDNPVSMRAVVFFSPSKTLLPS